MERLELPAVGDQLGGQPVEQFGVGRLVPLGPEVARRPDDPPAEVVLPDPVGHDPGGQGVVGAGDPVGQDRPTAGRLRARSGGRERRGRGADHLEEPGLDLVARGCAGSPGAGRGFRGPRRRPRSRPGPGRRATLLPLQLLELACGARDSCLAFASPRMRGAFATDHPGELGRGQRPWASRATPSAFGGRERPVREAGAGPGDGQARGRARPGNSRAGSARRPCFSSTVPDCSVPFAVDPVVLDDLRSRRRVSREPSSESR